MVGSGTFPLSVSPHIFSDKGDLVVVVVMGVDVVVCVGVVLGIAVLVLGVFVVASVVVFEVVTVVVCGLTVVVVAFDDVVEGEVVVFGVEEETSAVAAASVTISFVVSVADASVVICSAVA